VQQPFNHTGFNQYLAAHQLAGCRCDDCANLFLPPRRMCPNCYSTNIAWQNFSGNGVLIGHTTIYVGLSAMLEEGYTREHPYCSGVVRLNEGVTVSGQIVDADCAHPEELQVGTLVQAVFLERAGVVMLGFERQAGTERHFAEKTN